MIRKLLPLLVALFLLSIARAEGVMEHPAFTGSPYVLYNGGFHTFDAINLSGGEFVQYSMRDDLGRVGTAVAYLGPEHYQKGRESIQNQTPTGYKSAKYDFIPGGSLYHRCHLIAHRLTGSGEYAENLFTGTQYLNLGIMSTVEAKLAEYISRTGHHVLYKVAPDFLDNELVCRGVVMEAQSIEDDEIDLCIYCFNVQPGILIDYETGNNALAPYALTMPDLIIYSDTPDVLYERSNVEEEEVITYVLNTSRKRFHLPGCSSVADIKPGNRQDYTGTRSVLISLGYKPCGACNP